MTRNQQSGRSLAMDSVCKLGRQGDIEKAINKLRTVPGADNPFVTSQRTATSPSTRETADTSASQGTHTQSR